MKQTSKVLAFGENFCSGAYGISGNKTDKAPFDKTYPAIILGVNQKFVGDISEQNKTMVIEKFSIPEAVEEGEQTYYTFKINGAYYVKQQNGDFKLYDKIMVYIPNGDWSNMYFDYPDASSHGGSGGGGGESGDEHQLIVSVDVPGGAEPKLGDMWLFVREGSSTVFSELEVSDYVGMYTYQQDEDLEIQSWKSIPCTVGGNNPPSDGKVGNIWIKVENNYFSKIYLCTSVSSAIVWSEVYPDDETGEGYNLYISPDKPITEGDYWVEINNNTQQNIMSLSQYKLALDGTKYEWRLIYNSRTPAIYFQATDPAEMYEVKTGDYWIKTEASDMLIYNISRRSGRFWIRQGVAGGDLTINISHAILVQKDEVT